MLIMVCGLPGTGKSHLSRELARRIGAEYLNTDSIRNRALEQRTYSEEEKARVYGMMAEEAKGLLKKGKDVIVDATFYLRKYRDLMRAIADGEGVAFHPVLCVLEEGRLKERIEKRKGERTESEADFGVYLKLKAMFEPMGPDCLVVDMGMPEEEAIGKVLARVGR